MVPVTVVSEDILSEVILRRLLAESVVPYAVETALPARDRTGVARGSSYIEKRMPNFNNAAKHKPWVVLLDLDRRPCAVEYVSRLLPSGAARYMTLRIAVTEVESWLLADANAVAKFFAVARHHVPREPDMVPHAREALLNLARRGRCSRQVREAVLPHFPRASHGPDYNATMISFVYKLWNRERAAARSPSLSRAVAALDRMVYP